MDGLKGDAEQDKSVIYPISLTISRLAEKLVDDYGHDDSCKLKTFEYYGYPVEFIE